MFSTSGRPFCIVDDAMVPQSGLALVQRGHRNQPLRQYRLLDAAIRR